MPDANRGPLQPPELATAAVLGGLTVALTIFGWFVPYASAVAILAVVPMTVTGFRCRTRAVVASAVAAMGASFLLAGTGPLAGVGACAIVGGLVGHARRRSWGVIRVLVAALTVAAPVFAGVTDAVMAALPSFRKLVLRQLHNTLLGLTKLFDDIARSLSRVPNGRGAARWLGQAAQTVDGRADVALRNWWLSVPVILTLFAVGLTALAWYISAGVLARLDAMALPDPLGEDLDVGDRAVEDGVGGGEWGPVPAALVGVSYRYEGADRDALHDVSLRVEPGRLLTVVGDNGSGKSTLVRLLAGRAPTSGRIDRPGGVGLGRIGGTSLVAQRPESQVLGVRVADDVVWGLPVGTGVDVTGLLDTVGLAGMEERDTSTLSGGELQRLTVAGALAHRPRLLLSDESTAMVDAEGRRALTGLFLDLPASRGVAVVHVTHRAEEAGAENVIRLRRGRVMPGSPGLPDPDDDPGDLPAPSNAIRSWRAISEMLAAGAGEADRGGDGADEDGMRGARGGWGWGARTRARRAEAERPEIRDLDGDGAPAVLRVEGVSQVYAERTPWAQRALFDVDLEVGGGGGVLVVGGNGSGKSTLAWTMAGLLRPTEGVCLLDGRPVDQQVGRVGLAFQHARLQLQRSTVRSDVRAAAGVSAEVADQALIMVGLDPEELGGRQIDRLSGGQMRRVALAGILARRPRALILDEPLAGLDVPSRESLCRLLAELRAEAGLTLVVISHDLEGMEVVCDRVVELSHGRVVGDRALVGAVPVGAHADPDRRLALAASGPAAGVEPAGFDTEERASEGFDGASPPRGRSHDGAPAPVDGAPAASTPGSGTPAVAEAQGSRRRRRHMSFVLLRQVGRDTAIHRLWAGTKLVAVAALSLTLSIRPAWSTTAVVAAVVVGAALVARIPGGAIPRLPLIFWLVVLLGAGTTLLAGGAPFVEVGGTRLGLGDLDSYGLFTVLSLVLFGASLMVGWTTALGDVAPAIVRLGRPLRALGLPVEEWAVTMALCVRSLPLLVDELRTLVAARRLRPHIVDADGRRDVFLDAVDLCAASLVVALRRADEMGDAIRARGGTANFSARAAGPGRRDAVALGVVAAVCIGAFLIPT